MYNRWAAAATNNKKGVGFTNGIATHRYAFSSAQPVQHSFFPHPTSQFHQTFHLKPRRCVFCWTPGGKFCIQPLLNSFTIERTEVILVGRKTASRLSSKQLAARAREIFAPFSGYFREFALETTNKTTAKPPFREISEASPFTKTRTGRMWWRGEDLARESK